MATYALQPVPVPANENSPAINFPSVKSLFRALPDEDQVRFLAALYDEIRFDADTFHDALRDMAEEVSGFRASDDYADQLRADDIYPGTMHSKAARALYRTERDRRLDSSLAYIGRRAGRDGAAVVERFCAAIEACNDTDKLTAESMRSLVDQADITSGERQYLHLLIDRQTRNQEIGA